MPLETNPGLYRRALLLILSIVASGMASCLAGSPATNQLVLGMSTALTGPAEDLGKNMRLGVLAALEHANQAGGVHGCQLRLIALDDAYEPIRTAPNMRHLIEVEKVLAVIGNVGTPTAVAAIPIANEDHTLFFGPYTGASMMRKTPPDRYVIHYRASYAEEIDQMVEAVVADGGLEPEDIAFFTQRDAYGDAGFAAGVAALKRCGLRAESKIQHVRYERNTIAVENALANLLYAPREPRAIIMVGTYGPCSRFIQLAQEAAFNPVFLNVSFVGSRQLANNLGRTSQKVVVTQVVPHPISSDSAIVHEFRNDLKKLDPALEADFGSLEGYVVARILLFALEKNQGEPTREGIVDALEALGPFDIGLGEKLFLDRNEHQASHKIWLTILSDGKFVPFSSAELAALVKKAHKP